jgi:hypothetical protein
MSTLAHLPKDRQARFKKLMAGQIDDVWNELQTLVKASAEIVTKVKKVLDTPKLDDTLNKIYKDNKYNLNLFYLLKEFINWFLGQISNLMNHHETFSIPTRDNHTPAISRASRVDKPKDGVRIKVHSQPVIQKALDWGVYEGVIVKAVRKLGIHAVVEMAAKIARLGDSYFKYTDRSIACQRGLLLAFEFKKAGVFA